MLNRLKNRHFTKSMPLAFMALAALLAAGPAEARKPDNLVPSGEPVDCITLNMVRNTRVIDDRTIDFEIGRKIYRNTLPYSCPSLGFEKRFMIKTSINSLCSVDTVTVLQNFGNWLSQGPTCGLGKFQPMVKAPK